MTSSFVPFFALLASARGFEVIGILFWVWMIFECARRERRGSMQKILWLLLVILVPDFGALIYFLCRVAR